MATHFQTPIVTAQSMAADVTSAIIPINIYYGYAITAVYTTNGTLAGTFTLYASTDHEQDNLGNVIRAGTFQPVTNSAVTITGAGSWLWDVTRSSASYVKLVYAHFSGDSGTLNAYCTAKGT